MIFNFYQNNEVVDKKRAFNEMKPLVLFRDRHPEPLRPLTSDLSTSDLHPFPFDVRFFHALAYLDIHCDQKKSQQI